MRLFVLLLAGLVASGCAARGARPGDCDGAAIATVRNNWQRPIDVYAELERGAELILGEVTVGERREFTLPAGTSRLQYRWRTYYAGPPPTASDITTTYGCR